MTERKLGSCPLSGVRVDVVLFERSDRLISYLIVWAEGVSPSLLIAVAVAEDGTPGEFPSRARQETGFEHRGLSARLGLFWRPDLPQSPDRASTNFFSEIESSQEDDTPVTNKIGKE